MNKINTIIFQQYIINILRMIALYTIKNKQTYNYGS